MAVESQLFPFDAVGDEEMKTRLSRVDEAKVLRKIDCRVTLVLCSLYFLSYLDRINISNAVVFGLREDLKLKGAEFNTALVVFFIPCVLFDIPSNMLLKRFKPHVWVPFCMGVLGLVTIFQGLIHNFSGLVTTRFFLGLAEASVIPSVNYILAMWYKRTEAQKRYTFVYSGVLIAGAVGGLLASAVGRLDGILGYRGWRWMFIIEGAFTVVTSFILIFALPDFPEEVTWLSEDEKEFVKARLYDDVGHSNCHDPLTLKRVLGILKDWKIVVAGLMLLGLNSAAYCYAYFAPTIIHTLGYDPIHTQLLSVPPWVCSCGLAMLTAVLSDRLRRRYVLILVSLLVALTGFTILLIVHDNKYLQYAALILASAGLAMAIPIALCWPNTNLAGHHRRAVGTAFQISCSAVSGFVAAFSFLPRDAPRYITGYSVAVAFIVLALVSSTVYYLGISWENRRRDRMQKEGINAHLSEDEKKHMGDLSPDYRYLT
ncbi:MFS general substrate transporter [Fomes fomentarius]|nr:MFS general substrate transporter [Fomes fomentarius]